MTLREMIGQRMVSGFTGPVMTEAFKHAVREYKLGNVILFKHNVDSAEQLRTLCEDIQRFVIKETGHPAFITIDQEGGIVTRLPKEAVNVPGAMAVGATGDFENAYEAGRVTARQLRSFGINFNLAPVMDVNSNRNNPVIGVRSYGDAPLRVAEYGVRMMKGLVEGGVLSCAKHFPGHGDTAVDSHVGLPKIDKSIEELAACELIPFKAAIDSGIPAVMTTHILFPKIEEKNLPATMSRTIMTGILREKLGFNGLIISDCMMMKAIADHYGTVNGVVSAMHAGVDLVFVCHDPDLCCQAMDAVYAACENGTIDQAEMAQSAQRILHAKENMPGLRPLSGEEMAQDRDCARRIMDRALTLVHGEIPPLGDRPLFVGCARYASSLASNQDDDCGAFPEVMKKKLGGEALVTAQDPTDEEIADAVSRAKGCSAVVAASVNGTMRPGQLKLIRALCALDLPTVLVALRNPYDVSEYPADVCALCAYEYDALALDAVADALNGLMTPAGMLPVNL